VKQQAGPEQAEDMQVQSPKSDTSPKLKKRVSFVDAEANPGAPGDNSEPLLTNAELEEARSIAQGSLMAALGITDQSDSTHVSGEQQEHANVLTQQALTAAFASSETKGQLRPLWEPGHAPMESPTAPPPSRKASEAHLGPVEPVAEVQAPPPAEKEEGDNSEPLLTNAELEEAKSIAQGSLMAALVVAEVQAPPPAEEEERFVAEAAAQTEEERIAAEKKAEEERTAAEAAAKAEEEPISAEKKAEEDRLTAEVASEAEEERIAAEKKAEEERSAAEAVARAEEERIAAEKKAEEERLAAEAAPKAEEERMAAEKNAEEEKLGAEAAAKDEEERIAAERKAEEEKLAAQAKKAEEERLAAEAAAKAEEERIAAEKKAEEGSTDTAGTQFKASAPTRKPRASAAAAALRAGLRSGEVAKIIDEAEAKAAPHPEPQSEARISAEAPVIVMESAAIAQPVYEFSHLAAAMASPMPNTETEVSIMKADQLERADSASTITPRLTQFVPSQDEFFYHDDSTPRLSTFVPELSSKIDLESPAVLPARFWKPAGDATPRLTQFMPSEHDPMQRGGYPQPVTVEYGTAPRDSELLMQFIPLEHGSADKRGLMSFVPVEHKRADQQGLTNFMPVEHNRADKQGVQGPGSSPSWTPRLTQFMP